MVKILKKFLPSELQSFRASELVRGFTLIELLIVIGITGMISAFAITYSKTGQRQVVLYVEEQKIVSMIQRAKALTITTYNNTSVSQPKTCGYGIKINYAANTYSLFSYLPPTGPPPPVCNSITDVNSINSNPPPGVGQDQIDVSPGAQQALQTYTNIPLPRDLVFSASSTDALTYLLFVAPAPRTILSSDPGGISSSPPAVAKIYLETVDGKSSVQITVNSAGQVDF